jgi:hypothetical protein
MGKVLSEGDLVFDFSAAIVSDQFDDEATHKLSHCMKAVDFIVEWEYEFWFVEVKDPSNSKIPSGIKRDKLKDFISKIDNKTLFSDELGPKIKDSFLYLHLSGRLPPKPIKYLVLLAIETLDPALLLRSMEGVKRSSCFLGPDKGKWKNPYLEEVMVFNEQTWNEKLKQCPVKRSGTQS